MDDSIIAIIAAIAIGLFQLVSSINKRKRAQEQRMRFPPSTYTETVDFEDIKEPARISLYKPISLPRELKPEEEGGPMSDPIMSMEVEDTEGISTLLQDFTPLNAILFTEVMNPKWKT